jgi:NADPH2:quinone reductase
VEIKVMKFVEASKFGGPEVLTLVEAPTPTPQEATLLVEVRAAGVNYADINIL